MTSKVFPLPSLANYIPYRPLLQDQGEGLTLRRRSHILSRPIQNKLAKSYLEKPKHKLRGILLWTRILKNIRIYGASSKHLHRSPYIKPTTNVRLRGVSQKTYVFQPVPTCLFHPNSKVIQVWSLLMLFLLQYVFIGTPWIIAFEEVTIGSTLFYIELAVDLLFFCDILVTLNSAYFQNEELITSRWAIFCNYLNGLLLIDIIAIFPFYVFEEEGTPSKSNGLVRIIRITKVTRVFRASKLFKLLKNFTTAKWLESSLKVLKEYEGVARLLALSFFILIMAHITACMWVFTAKLDDFAPDTWVVRNDLANHSKGHLYLVSLYWAFTILTTVGFGDIHPVTTIEMLLCIFWLIFGIGFYTFLVGTLTSVLSSLDHKSAYFQRIIQEVEQFAKEYEIKKPLLKVMKKEVSQHGQVEKMDEQTRVEVLSLIPMELKYQVCLSMNNNAVKQVQFLHDQDILFITDIVPRLEYEVMPSESIVYELSLIHI